jgi:hypothetical protein
MQVHSLEITSIPSFSRSPDLSVFHRQIRQTRPDLGSHTRTYQVAVLLLCGPAVRFNIDRLARLTGYARAFVAISARRLFDNGVWDHGDAAYSWIGPAEPDFWRDVAVAEGRLCRRRCVGGAVEWAEPGVWKKQYDFVVDKNPSHTITYIAESDAAVAPAFSLTETTGHATADLEAERHHPAAPAVISPPSVARESDIERSLASHCDNRLHTHPNIALAEIPTFGQRVSFFPNAQWL